MHKDRSASTVKSRALRNPHATARGVATDPGLVTATKSMPDHRVNRAQLAFMVSGARKSATRARHVATKVDAMVKANALAPQASRETLVTSVRPASMA